MKHLRPEEAAAALRDELLALGWPTSAEVGRANCSQTTDPARWAKTKRDAGELLGVWSPADRTWRHPSFQFYADGTLHPRIQELLVTLAESSDFSPDNDRGGWRRAFWLCGSSYGLAGPDGEPRAPAEVFLEDPDSVIRWAHGVAAVLDANLYW